MIVLDKGKLKFLLAGRSVPVDVTRAYRKGRTYAVGLTHQRTVCRVRIEDSVQTPDGWQLIVACVREERPRLLAASPARSRSDYTDDPMQAARGEPEALTEAQVRDLTKYRAALAENGRSRSMAGVREHVTAVLDDALRTAVTREDRDKIRAAKHHVGKLGRAS